MTGADGPDSTEDSGVAAGAAPAELWTSLCSCRDKFPGFLAGGRCPHRAGRRSAVEQIVASRATDHGGNRESEQLLRVGADRGVVPQIMEEFVMVRWCRRCSSCGYGRLCDHAATWCSEQWKYLRFSLSQESVDIPAV